MAGFALDRCDQRKRGLLCQSRRRAPILCGPRSGLSGDVRRELGDFKIFQGGYSLRTHGTRRFGRNLRSSAL